jgi:hypothetical protein
MDISAWIEHHCFIDGTYAINDNECVDVDGSVVINTSIKITKIPIKFGAITEDFDCSENKLTSLEGGPIKVGGYFNCSHNQLTSLEGSPREIGKSFYCHNNYLTSLIGAPNKVGDTFECRNNKLTSLKGLPEEIEDFYCDDYLKDTYEYKWWVIKKFLRDQK